MDIIPVGQIENEYHADHPERWVTGLYEAILTWFDELTEDGKKKWGKNVNCHKFARKVIQKLGLTVPDEDEMSVRCDLEPWLVDGHAFVHVGETETGGISE